MAAPRAIFGIPDVWEEIFRDHEAAFRALETLRSVAAELVEGTKGDSRDQIAVLNALADISAHSSLDVILLAGNNRGTGAMRIARGMFEAGVIARYLERNPNDVRDYLDFVAIESWRHLQTLEKHHPGTVDPKLMTDAQAEHDRVKPRFLNTKGNVQPRWTTDSIKKMADEVGRLNIYEIAYSAASELHHLPLIGVIAHEFDWLKEATFIAYGSLLDAVVALYNASAYEDKDFRTRLDKAIADHNLLR